MAWVILVIAGLFEVVWASAMKQSHGFSRLWPSVVTIAAMLVASIAGWVLGDLLSPLGPVVSVTLSFVGSGLAYWWVRRALIRLRDGEW